MKPVVTHKRKQMPLYSQLPSDFVKEVKDFMTKVEKGLYELFQCTAFQGNAEKTSRKEVKAKRGRVQRIAKKKSLAA